MNQNYAHNFLLLTANSGFRNFPHSRIMAALVVQDIRAFMNSTTSVFPDDFLNFSTSQFPEPVTVPESLQTTRVIVQNVLTPVVATVGLLGNILNILVLFQPSMRTSTNVYLLVLSLADSVFLLFNLILSILDCRKRDLTDSAYHFNPYGRFLSNYSGNVAVWVTVVFTVERYIAVCHPINGKVWCTVSRAKLASTAVTVLVMANTVPTVFELEVVDTETGPRCSSTPFARSYGYEIGYSWWYVTVFTFIPLVFLTIFNTVLIRALFLASRKREQMALISTSRQHHKSNGKEHNRKTANSLHVSHSVSQCQISENFSSFHTSDKSSPSAASVSLTKKRQSRRFSREQNKVTLLLVTIVMIFLLCQLPWTALFLYKTYLSGNNLDDSSTAIKIAGNICNLLGLINASVNFYLYSCFSKRFRRTLAKLIMFWRRKNSSPTTV
nr:thyrotropin-releasing hormone receptor-like [Biomphalaria glabrata]